MIRVFIAADVRLYRDGLAEALARTPAITVVDSGPSGPDVVPRIVELRPDVVLIDVRNAQSDATARELQQTAPDVPIVALGVENSEDEILRCAEAGIIGYVTNDIPLQDLIPVIESATRGEAPYSPKVARTLVRKLAALAADRQPSPASVQLTARERQIVALLEQELSNKEIASRLGVGVATVKKQVHHLLERLGVHRRAEISRSLKEGPRADAAGGHRRRGGDTRRPSKE